MAAPTRTRARRPKPVYALVRLSYNAGGRAFWRTFEIGDRIDEALPADVVSTVLSNGEASHTKPETTE